MKGSTPWRVPCVMNIKTRLLGEVSPEALLEKLGLVMSATAPKNNGGGKTAKKGTPPPKKGKKEDEDVDDNDDDVDEEEDEEDDEEDDEDEETLKLRAKHQKAVKEAKSLRARIKELEKKEEEQDAEEEANQGNLKKVNERLTKQIETLTKERDEAVTALSTKVVDEGLSNALDSINVNPKLKKGALSVIRAEHEIEMEDGECTIDGEPVDKFMKRWGKSETGKAYVKLKSNGGGANGSGDGGDGGDGNSDEVNPFKKDTWNMTAQGQLYKSDKNKYERLKKEAGLVTK